MLISVIIPVYNVEDYLHYAVDSLLNQSYEEFEIILIDDGSTDSSGYLCDKYAREYSNISVYHKENGGLSEARNFGVLKCKGEYITFLDPDDYLEPYTLELMNRLQMKYSADVVSLRVCGTPIHNDYSGKITVNENDIKDVLDVNKEEALIEMFYDDNATVSSCGKLFKKSLFDDIKFPKGRIYEDLAIVAKYIDKSNTVIISRNKAYKYYKREGSIVNSKFSDKRFDFYSAIEENRKYIMNSIKSNKVIEALDVKMVVGSFSIIDAAISDDNITAIYKIRKLLCSKIKIILLNTRLSFKVKMKYLLFIVFPKLYKKLKRRGR